MKVRTGLTQHNTIHSPPSESKHLTLNFASPSSNFGASDILSTVATPKEFQAT
jgi:hypothetical protein